MNYWILQGSLKYYRIKSALRDKAIHSWPVSAHKYKMAVGDKAILWMTGREAGCYALCEIASRVFMREQDTIEQQYYTENKTEEVAGDAVEINVLHSFINRPVLWRELKGLNEFQKFSAGNPGTSFRATKEQYDTILTIGQQEVGPQFFKYSPGEQAFNWQKDYVAGEARLGYSELDTGSLIKFPTLEALNLHLGFPPENKSNKTWALFLLKSAQEGNVIFAIKGAMRLEGIGIIQGQYRYEPKEKYPHVRPVHWLTAEPWEYTANLFPGYPKLFRPDTFSPTAVGPEIIEEYLKKYPQYYELFRRNGLLTEEEDVEVATDNLVKSALNTIIYGPPGTGKTYATITRAVKIITGKELSHAEAKKRFDILIKSGQIEFITFHQNYAYEDFVLGLKPDLDVAGEMRFRQHEGVFYRLATRARHNWERSRNKPRAQESLKNFVLIIDEINRANVSRVFGELITLLEEDKRLGAANALTLRLPSQTEQEPRFGVPPNLYLIGTMNTADKSIALVDVALRRRFAFEALYPPKPGESMPGLSPFYQQKLEVINRELLRRRGSDFLLGHAFFLDKSETELEEILQKTIIPLLFEYFNGKIEAVREVMKAAGITLTGEWPPYAIHIGT